MTTTTTTTRDREDRYGPMEWVQLVVAKSILGRCRLGGGKGTSSRNAVVEAVSLLVEAARAAGRRDGLPVAVALVGRRHEARTVVVVARPAGRLEDVVAVDSSTRAAVQLGRPGRRKQHARPQRGQQWRF